MSAPDGLTLAEKLRRMPSLLTAKKLSEMLAIAPCTLYKMARAGTIPALHLGYGVRFDPTSVATWLDSGK